MCLKDLGAALPWQPAYDPPTAAVPPVAGPSGPGLRAGLIPTTPALIPASGRGGDSARMPPAAVAAVTVPALLLLAVCAVCFALRRRNSCVHTRCCIHAKHSAPPERGHASSPGSFRRRGHLQPRSESAPSHAQRNGLFRRMTSAAESNVRFYCLWGGTCMQRCLCHRCTITSVTGLP